MEKVIELPRARAAEQNSRSVVISRRDRVDREINRGYNFGR